MDVFDRIRALAPQDRLSDEDLASARAALTDEIARDAPRRLPVRRIVSIAAAVVAIAGVALGSWAIGTRMPVAPAPMATPTATATLPPSVELRQSFLCSSEVISAEAIEHPMLASELDEEAKAAFAQAGASIAEDAEEWIVAVRTPDSIELLKGPIKTGYPIGRYESRVIGLDPSGTWSLKSYGECGMAIHLEGRTSVVPIASGVGDQSHSDTIGLLVMEQNCAGGQSAEGRVRVLSVEETATEVRLVIGVEGRDGAFTCQGNPWTPVTVRLSEPLGERTLWNDGYAVPREIGSMSESLE